MVVGWLGVKVGRGWMFEINQGRRGSVGGVDKGLAGVQGPGVQGYFWHWQRRGPLQQLAEIEMHYNSAIPSQQTSLKLMKRKPLKVICLVPLVSLDGDAKNEDTTRIA